jgi:hypothetical protein
MVREWVFKISNQVNGMGLAIFDVNSFDIAERLFIKVEDLLKHKDKVNQIIKTSINNKLYIACRSVYSDT